MPNPQSEHVGYLQTKVRLLEDEVEALKLEKHILQYTLDAVLAKAMGDSE